MAIKDIATLKCIAYSKISVAECLPHNPTTK